MSKPEDIRLLALLGLRLKGFADADAVAETVGADEDEISSALESAESIGLVSFNEARAVYMLDPVTGRAEGEGLLAAQLDELGARDTVSQAYQAFLELNGVMLQLCTDWQVREIEGAQTLNHHADASYDATVIARLVELDAELASVLDVLTSALDRYHPYQPRFHNALTQLQAGELDYFTKPLIPSYHTVWFELHEDLLATLGIDRAMEGNT